MMNEEKTTEEVVIEDDQYDEEIPRPNPIRSKDVVDTITTIGRDAKDGVLQPVYEQGWRWMGAVQDAARSFIRGAVSDIRDKDKR